jgi:regulator of replication initiation timing
MNKKNKQISCVNNATQVIEIVEHIDNENIRICLKQNSEIKCERNYVIREKYENEKKHLEEQIRVLTIQVNENSKLREILETQISELINDKLILEQKIKKLEEENTELKQEVKQLKIENAELKQEVKQLKIENTELRMENKIIKSKLSKIEMRQMIKTFMIVLQDINRHRKLRDTVRKSYFDCFENLRLERNSIAHYINDENDTLDVCDYKCFKLLDFRNELELVHQYIDRRVKCNGFVKKFLRLIEDEKNKSTIQVSDEDKEDVELWWSDNL